MSAADHVQPLYEREAAAWDAERVGPFFERAWIDRFLALLQSGGTVLDLGCGSGRPISLHCTSRGFRVTGIDTSPALIRLCAERMPEQAWRVEDMRTLALGTCFDGLIAWDSFFHLRPDDQRRMFGVFAAHAAPRAPLLFTSGPAAGEAIGSWRGAPLYHASLDPDEYRTLLGAHGFELLDHVAEDPECGRHTIWLARRR